jgi:hypothetical protein
MSEYSQMKEQFDELRRVEVDQITKPFRDEIAALKLQVREMRQALLLAEEELAFDEEHGKTDDGERRQVNEALAVIREALGKVIEKRVGEMVECAALLMQPGPIKKCGLKAGHDGACAEVLDDKRKVQS